MEDGGAFGDGSCVGVDGGADDDGGDGHAADEAAEEIAGALGEEFAVGRGDAFLGVEFVGGFEVEEGFEGSDDGQGGGGGVDGWVGEGGEVGPAEEGGGGGEVGDFRDLDEVGGTDGEGGAEFREEEIEESAEGDDGEGSRDEGFFERGAVPCEEEGEAEEADDGGAGLDVADGGEEFGEGSAAIVLLVGEVAFVVWVVADEVGELFDDEDDADGGEEALDDVGGEVVGEEAGLEETEDDLEDA